MLAAIASSLASPSNAVIVDDLLIDLSTPAHRQHAWALAAETLAKPLLQRSDVEISRVMTLFRNLKAIADMKDSSRIIVSGAGAAVGSEGAEAGTTETTSPTTTTTASSSTATSMLPNFQARLQLTKAARMLRIGPGVVILSKGKEGDPPTVIEMEKPSQNNNNPNVPPSSSLRTNSMGGPASYSTTMNGVRSRPSAVGGGSGFFPQPPSQQPAGAGSNTNNTNASASSVTSTFNRTSGGAVALVSSVAMVGASEFNDDDFYNDEDFNNNSNTMEGGDGDGTGNKNKTVRMFYIVVKGEVVLERPTVNGRVRTEVREGEALGNQLASDALPCGSFYLTLTETQLLAIPWRVYSQFLQRDFDECEIKKRVNFFQQSIVVPVFQPFAELRYRWLARCCYTIHLQSKEIAVREGDFSDCVYFIVSGKMKVIREIDFSSALGHTVAGIACGGAATGGDGSGSDNNATTLGGNSNSNNTTTAATLNGTANIKLLDLATLEPGEYFGELGILRHSVDEQTSTSIEELLTITNEDVAGVYKERELTRIEPSIASIPRQATVYAETPATLLALPRDCFIALVQQGALVRFREYAKGYPSVAAIKAHFMRDYRWNAFKTRVYEEDYKR